MNKKFDELLAETNNCKKYNYNKNGCINQYNCWYLKLYFKNLNTYLSTCESYNDLRLNYLPFISNIKKKNNLNNIFNNISITNICSIFLITKKFKLYKSVVIECESNQIN